MGRISIDGRRLRSSGIRSKIRLRGKLIHLGPKSTLLLKGGGRGQVTWRDLVGEGRYEFRGNRYALKISYLAAGFYSYQMSVAGEVVCEGRMSEEQELYPYEDASDYALSAG